MVIDIAMLASVIGAVVTIVSGVAFLTRPARKIFKRFDERFDELELDIKSIREKFDGIEDWTGAQQEDIDVSLRERRIIFNAVHAINDWAIQSGGNGKCQEAKRQMDDFIHEFAHRGKSGSK